MKTFQDIEVFVGQHEPRWSELEALLDRAAEVPRLTPAELQDLVRLYRLACSDLNQLRGITANPDLLGRLNQLVGRGYRWVYQHRSRRWKRGWPKRFFFVDAPATARAERRSLVVAAVALLLGAAVGAAAVAKDPEDAAALIPSSFYVEHPRDRVAQVEGGPERIDSAAKATAFGAFLYDHNIRVSLVAFTLCAATLVLGWLLIFYNGVLLGAIAAQYFLDGVGTFFVAWVGPHGVLELPAILVAAAAGFRLGAAVWIPGEEGRAAAVRRAFLPCARLLGVSVFLLVLAGIIEGSFSQFSARLVSYPVKIGVAALLFLGLVGWLLVPWREARRS